tara:strand:- start:153 stop:341 length:189 start_codon:yes stop_codon:yes gene_type:complete
MTLSQKETIPYQKKRKHALESDRSQILVAKMHDGRESDQFSEFLKYPMQHQDTGHVVTHPVD